jgi:hypothetical protein
MWTRMKKEMKMGHETGDKLKDWKQEKMEDIKSEGTDDL